MKIPNNLKAGLILEEDESSTTMVVGSLNINPDWFQISTFTPGFMIYPEGGSEVECWYYNAKTKETADFLSEILT
jgi:hypothetical protein